MGRIVVRKQKETKNPYVIPGLNRKVYSLEELVYSYFYNISFLEEKVVDMTLCDWLEWEMERTELAGELRNLVLHNCKADEFLQKIFAEISFCTEKEMEEVERILSSWTEQNPGERKKARLRHLMEKGCYKEAAETGLKLLTELEDGTEEKAEIYHNLGVLCAKGFYFDMAADLFQKAYQINNREETRELYMLSLRMSLSKPDYVERIRKEELGEERAVQLEEKILELLPEEKSSRYRMAYEGLVEEWERGNHGLFQDDLRNLLGEWKEKWRYS